MRKNLLFVIAVIGLLYIIYSFFNKDKKYLNNSQNQKWAVYDSNKAKELKLDVDAIQKAFKIVKGPQEFEKKVNEIYTGNEILSINVQDNGNKNQKVTIYIDNNPKNEKMESGEKILTLDREITNNQQVAIKTTGYGPYSYYSSTSPLVYGIVSGLTSYWIMNSLMYNTPLSRYSDMRDYRKNYRTTSSYKQQEKKTQQFSKNFKKNAPEKYQNAPKTFSKSKQNSTNKSGSWNRGNKSARNPRTNRRKFRTFGRKRGFGFRFRRR